MPYEFKESDWKLFRKKLPQWQERYIGRLIEEYETHLQGEGLASKKFWWLWDHMKEDKKLPGVVVDRVSRSRMVMIMENLLLTDAITSLDDLEGFSEPLVADLVQCAKHFGEKDSGAVRLALEWLKKHPDFQWSDF